MKNILKYIIIATLVAMLFVSCDTEVGSGGGGSSGSGSSGSSSPSPSEFTGYSKLVMTFNNASYSTSDGVYDYEYNLDNSTSLSTNFVFEARHYKTDGTEYTNEKAKFSFSCDEIDLYNVTDNSCTINALNIKEIGTYTVYAKSSLGSEYDRYFMIYAVANSISLAVEYNILPEYINNNLEYTDAMKSGSITKYTRELTLVAGAVYKFTVEDKSENEYAVRNITVASSSNRIYFREQSGASGEFVCMPSDGETSTLTFSVGTTKNSVSVKITLSDISQASIEYLDPAAAAAEEVISLVPNPSTDSEKIYTYQVDLQSVLPLASQELMFCIDYENWDEQAENDYLDVKNYKVSPSTNINWYSRTSLFKVWDDEVLYQIIFDGPLGQFSIVPKADTVFTSTNHGTKNLHTYIYAKYKNDPNTVYRWKWRIMVGGVLDAIELYIVDGNTETKLDSNTMDIQEDTLTGWKFKALQVPSSTSNSNTLWYVAKNNQTQEYRWLSNSQVVTAVLPVPAVIGNDNASSVLSMLDGQQISSGVRVNPVSSIEENEKDLKVYNFYWDASTEEGSSINYINYNNNGSDCVLVVLNLETGVFRTLTMKNYNEASVIIKSLDSTTDPVPAQVKTLRNNSKVTYYTNYSSEQTNADNGYYGQFYGTIEVGGVKYKGGSGFLPAETPDKMGISSESYRVFYQHINSQLHLQLKTTFDVTNAVLSGNFNAVNTFAGFANVYISTDKRTIDIYLPTNYASYSDADKEDPSMANELREVRKECTNPYSELYLEINGKYNLFFKVIVYDPDLI